MSAVPVSWLRARSRTVSIENGETESQVNDYDAEMNWILALGERNVPTAYDWDDEDSRVEGIPEEVRIQLVGQTVGAGLRFSHSDLKCYVVDSDFDLDDLGKVITAEIAFGLCRITGIEMRYIDLNA